MKNARTVRTIRRAGIQHGIGFAGWLPSGKAVRKMARALRAERKAADQLFEAGGEVATSLFRGLRPRQYARAASKFLAAPQVVRDAWLKQAALK